MIKEELLNKLEFKIYRFSVNVFSFVKTLIEKKLSNQYSEALLVKANDLYSSYVNLLDSFENEGVVSGLFGIIEKSENCVTLFQDIELTGSILNEKVDLAIEAFEISKQLKELINKK
jgi:hypothetical protein